MVVDFSIGLMEEWMPTSFRQIEEAPESAAYQRAFEIRNRCFRPAEPSHADGCTSFRVKPWNAPGHHEVS